MIHAPSDLYPVTPAQMASLSADLVALGESLERSERPEWLTAARAAAVLDGLRLGLISFESGGEHGAH